MSIYQISTRFSVLAFQICSYVCQDPDFLEELKVLNFEDRYWIFKDVYCFHIHRGPTIFNSILRCSVTSLCTIDITLILSLVGSQLPSNLFSRRKILQCLSNYYFSWLCVTVGSCLRTGTVVCSTLQKILSANQIIKWKIISIGEYPRQIIRYKTVFSYHFSQDSVFPSQRVCEHWTDCLSKEVLHIR